MRFINRQTTNPNRKTLNVTSVNYDPNTGELSSLIVEESNNDGPVIVEGTKLNATNLNSIFDNLGRNFFCHHYYNEVHGIDIDDENYTIEITGNTPIDIPYTFDTSVTLYPLDPGNNNFSITFNNNTITITRTNNLNDSDSGKIKIEFYQYSDYTFLECTINIIYTYTPASTNPLD